MNKQKTVIMNVRLTPLDRARLDAEAKDAGTDLSKWVRTKLGIDTIGTVDSNTGKVVLVQGNGERIPLTSEEIFASE